MKGWTPLIVGTALVLVALVVFSVLGTMPWTGNDRRGTWGPGMRPRGAGPSEFASNGERIYFTARSGSSEPIGFTEGPHWFQMHGGSCVSCHGPDGRGGVRVPMTDQIAPDIRYSTLTSAEHETEGGEEHPPYTEEMLGRAITDGLDPAGEPLSWVMPRWRMSERDLSDLVDYLKSLDGR